MRERLADGGAVHVRDEVQARRAGGERLERGGGHRRAEVGAADPDVHDVGNPGPGVTGPLPAANRVAERADVLERGADVGHDVTALHQHRAIRHVSKSDVENRTLLGAVDRLAGKHPIAERFDTSRTGQPEQQPHGLVVDVVLGVVHDQIAEAEREAARAIQLLVEHERQLPLSPGGGVGAERLPV